MKKYILAMIFLGLTNLFACSSDFNCGIGYSCVKKPFQSEGLCMKNVDENGIQQYNMPSSNSIGPNMDTDGQCNFDTDCPIGFRCNSEYKVCIKR